LKSTQILKRCAHNLLYLYIVAEYAEIFTDTIERRQNAGQPQHRHNNDVIFMLRANAP
jgi:hypothetical protein